jgi:similar to stage IV sporulation protein
MTLGSIEYKIEGENFSRLLAAFTKEKLIYSALRETDDCLTLTVSFEHSFRFEKLCRKVGFEPKKIAYHGMLRFYRSLFKRPGLIVGAVLSVLLMAYYSNVILTITVDTDDPVVYGKVIDVLNADGVKAGAYLPDIDLVIEERSLKRQIDEVAWAGISRTGSGIAVDINEAIEAEKGTTVGMPCHLVACEDGVIEEIELIDGQLMKCLGSGVTKGEIVVSGKIVTENSEWTKDGEVITSKTRYVRSIGKIRGTFIRTMVFEQPFDTEEKVLTGETKKLSYLEIFSARIPISAKIPDGCFETEKEEKHFPEICGFLLPMGIREIDLREFDIRSQVLDKDEALSLAEKAAYRYEQNFLTPYEIRGRSAKTELTDNGVKLTVTYELYGNLCKESDFFIPKYIIPDLETLPKENVQDSENY